MLLVLADLISLTAALEGVSPVERDGALLLLASSVCLITGVKSISPVERDGAILHGSRSGQIAAVVLRNGQQNIELVCGRRVLMLRTAMGAATPRAEQKLRMATTVDLQSILMALVVANGEKCVRMWS